MIDGCEYAPVQLPKALLENSVPAHMHRQVLPPDPLVQPLQLCSEVPPLDVKVEHPGVVDQHAERPVCQVGCGLPQYLIQHRPMSLGKLKELFGVGSESGVVGGISLGDRILVGFALQLAFLLLNVGELLLSRLLLVWLLFLLTLRHCCVHKEKHLHSWLKDLDIDKNFNHEISNLENKNSMVVRSLCELL